MKKSFVFTFILATTLSCSKPIADFTIQSDSNSAPTYVNFKNTSVGAESFSWSIDNVEISDTLDLDHLFLSSGRHMIKLTASKDQKQSVVSKELIVDAPQECLVYMKTSHGDLLFSLSDLAPKHRDNFLELTSSSFYEGIIFHRVINGFMAQAGDGKTRKGNSKREAEYTIEEEINNQLIHRKGALAAARMPDDINPSKASSGSQFYIVSGRGLTLADMEDFEASKLFEYTPMQLEEYTTHGGTPQLDGEYTIFGHLVEGYETLDRISKVKTGKRDRPEEEVVILKVISIN